MVYSVLRFFFRRKRKEYMRNLLFINSGQIGDLIVSSLLLENENHLSDFENIYFVIKKQYVDLFKSYKGRIKIIGYNSKAYKYFPIYKLKLLTFLYSLQIEKCFNLTAARGVINDEMALLSGAKETYCLNSDWRYLKKLFGKKMDKKYTAILGTTEKNEYNKHYEVLEFLGAPKEQIRFDNKVTFINDDDNLFILQMFSSTQKWIAIAPFASIEGKEWGINNFNSLCKSLGNEYSIMLLGSKDQQKRLNLIASGEKILNLIGKLKLPHVVSVLQKCHLFIGQDSGLTHLALRLRKKVIAIVGGGSFGRFLPIHYNPNSIFLYDKMDCFGCEWRCIYKEKYCLTNVSADKVLDSALSLLNAD